MAVSAFFSEVYSQRFYFAHPPNSQAFFILPIFYVIAFTTLSGQEGRGRYTDIGARRNGQWLAVVGGQVVGDPNFRIAAAPNTPQQLEATSNYLIAQVE